MIFGYLAGLGNQVAAVDQELHEDQSGEEGMVAETQLEDPFNTSDQPPSSFDPNLDPAILFTPSRPKWSDYTNTEPSPIIRPIPSRPWKGQTAGKGLYTSPSTAVSSLTSTPASFTPGRFATKGLFSTPSKPSKSSISSRTSIFPANENAIPLTQDKDLQAFIEPNLNITYSIDHGTTNPDTTHRLSVPYPAPKDILLSSRQRYAANVSEARRLKQLGMPEHQRRVPWTVFEDDQVIKYMLAIRNDDNIPKSEARFEEVSRRMEADGLEPRSKTAIKNMWCRVGRGRSGYDERKGMRRDARFVVNKWKADESSPRKRKKLTKRERMVAEEKALRKLRSEDMLAKGGQSQHGEEEEDVSEEE